jgi:Zn-dependent protease
MDRAVFIREALLAYLFFIPLLTLHEWAHAWTAWKCGDDTAYKRGRVSINPIVHMELIGTVILPLAGIISRALGAGVIIGWGKPVPIDPNKLKHPRLQDSLIAMAGPAMNFVLAFALVGLTKALMLTGQLMIADIASQMATLSLYLCFFNLLPIPPLDGSHLILNLTRMSYELYFRLSIIGFVAVMVLLQFRPVQIFLVKIVTTTFVSMARIFQLQ